MNKANAGLPCVDKGGEYKVSINAKAHEEYLGKIFIEDFRKGSAARKMCDSWSR